MENREPHVRALQKLCAATKSVFGPKLVKDSSTARCKAESGFLPEAETKVLVRTAVTE
jgi:hypothetical protein